MRELTQFNSTVAITAGVVGGLALATSLMLQLNAPPKAPTEDRIRVIITPTDGTGKNQGTPVVSPPVHVP